MFTDGGKKNNKTFKEESAVPNVKQGRDLVMFRGFQSMQDTIKSEATSSQTFCQSPVLQEDKDKNTKNNSEMILYGA